MKTNVTNILLFVASCNLASAGELLTDWQTTASQIASNVTNSTNNGVGYVLNGKGIPYDYGKLNNGDPGKMHRGNSIEYIFNLTDSGESISIGSLNGWDNSEFYSFKLEQTENSKKFGVTSKLVADAHFPESTSIFDTYVHVIFITRTDNNIELYINGVSQGINSRERVWVTNGGVGLLGANHDGSDPAQGTILAVASYNKPLTKTEITQLYQAYRREKNIHHKNIVQNKQFPPSSATLIGIGGINLNLQIRE